MTRIVAAFCFALTLLCPVTCLAGRDDGCADHLRANGDNCEAMSVGAVVAKSSATPGSLEPCGPVAHPSLLVGRPPDGLRRGSSAMSRGREAAKPPPASRRQALLQVFLF